MHITLTVVTNLQLFLGVLVYNSGVLEHLTFFIKLLDYLLKKTKFYLIISSSFFFFLISKLVKRYTTSSFEFGLTSS
jgi:hypothetical protein